MYHQLILFYLFRNLKRNQMRSENGSTKDYNIIKILPDGESFKRFNSKNITRIKICILALIRKGIIKT